MPCADQDATAAGPDRRAVIRGAGAVGLAAVGATALAACGSASTAGAPAGGSSSGGASSAATTTAGAGTPAAPGASPRRTSRSVAAPSSQRPGRSSRSRPPGEFKAFSSICTHMGCPVGIGRRRHHQLPLPRQQVRHRDRRGERGPATRPLPAKTVTVKGDQLTVT